MAISNTATQYTVQQNLKHIIQGGGWGEAAQSRSPSLPLAVYQYQPIVDSCRPQSRPAICSVNC